MNLQTREKISRELQFCTSHLRITIDRSKHSEATCADLFSLSICARGAWDVGCVQRQLALRYCVCVSRGKWRDLAVEGSWGWDV